MDLEQVATAASVEPRATTETQFIERLKRGDAAAFEVLVSERSGEIYGLLYRLTENSEEARDLTQETFLRAFQSIEHFRGDADLRTWIYRIAINQARNRWRWWRRRRRDSTVSLDSAGERGGKPLNQHAARRPWKYAGAGYAGARTRRSSKGGAANVSDGAYRETVILRDIEGLSYEEVAATLGLA